MTRRPSSADNALACDRRNVSNSWLGDDVASRALASSTNWVFDSREKYVSRSSDELNSTDVLRRLARGPRSKQRSVLDSLRNVSRPDLFFQREVGDGTRDLENSRGRPGREAQLLESRIEQLLGRRL